jgi:hypothetical protein
MKRKFVARDDDVVEGNRRGDVFGIVNAISPISKTTPQAMRWLLGCGCSRLQVLRRTSLLRL